MAFEPDDLETAASANILTDESLVVNPLTLINGRGLRRVRVNRQIIALRDRLFSVYLYTILSMRSRSFSRASGRLSANPSIIVFVNHLFRRECLAVCSRRCHQHFRIFLIFVSRFRVNVNTHPFRCTYICTLCIILLRKLLQFRKMLYVCM